MREKNIISEINPDRKMSLVEQIENNLSAFRTSPYSVSLDGIAQTDDNGQQQGKKTLLRKDGRVASNTHSALHYAK